MKVLVTGSEGFFGSWLIPALGEAGHDVVRYDRKLGQDILNRAQLDDAMQGVEGVVHLAAIPHWRPEIPAVEYQRTNVRGTASVVDAFIASDANVLVVTSSGALYGFGPGRDTGWVTPPITETKRPRSGEIRLDDYRRSKLEQLAYLESVADQFGSRPVTSLRINCIEPHHVGAAAGDHWGWWTSQATAIKAYLAALSRKRGGLMVVNVGEPNPNLNPSRLNRLLKGGA